MTLNGLVLAGGKSSRMGRDKAALVYHGADQAHHLASMLEPYVEQLFVSVQKGASMGAHLQGLQTIEDFYAAPTPLNGIVSAMRHAPGASWLVVAVDMPHITDAAIKTLLQGRDASKIATCFESPAKGGPDPLFAVWEGHGFAVLEPLVQHTQEHICPRRTLKTLGAHILKNAVPPEVLANFNTPEEWRSMQVRKA